MLLFSLLDGCVFVRGGGITLRKATSGWQHPSPFPFPLRAQERTLRENMCSKLSRSMRGCKHAVHSSTREASIRRRADGTVSQSSNMREAGVAGAQGGHLWARHRAHAAGGRRRGRGMRGCEGRRTWVEFVRFVCEINGRLVGVRGFNIDAS